MPSPKKGEKRKDFLSRCMGDGEARKDFPENDQRYAFCVSQWDRRKKKNVSSENKTNYLQVQREDSVSAQIPTATLHITESMNGTTTTYDNGSLTVSDEFGDALRSGLSFRLNAALVQEVEENGRRYLVTPVVAIREGVLNGEFVPAQEIAISTDQWNGVPITIGHPQLDGNPVSLVQHPDVTSDVVIGEFRHAAFDGKGLHGEIWIDVELAEKAGEDGEYVLSQLRGEDPMEVSTGYIAAVNHQSGTFGEEVYSGVQAGIIPDHLALLPYEQGACSWSDGCGTPRVNASNEIESDRKTCKVCHRYVVTPGQSHCRWHGGANSLANRPDHYEKFWEMVNNKTFELMNYYIHPSKVKRKEDTTIGNKALNALKMLGSALGYDVHTATNHMIVQTEDQNEIVQNISDCCRCGNDHSELKFKRFSQSEEGCPFDIWTLCPDTEEPILSVHNLKVNGANLGTLLTQMITDQITNDRPRRTIIKAMADRAGTSTDKVKSIIAGDVEFIPHRWLQGFAQELDVSVWDLMLASDRDIQSFMDKNLPTDTSTEQPIAMQAEESTEENVEEETGNETDSAETTLNTEEVEVMPEIRELADAVLANEALSFTDEDREWLETLPEEKLQAMAAKAPVETPEEEVLEEPETEEPEVVATPPVTVTDLLATVENTALKSSIEEMLRTNDEICAGLISQITENSEFTEDELSGKSVSELKKLAALAAPKESVSTPSYVGAGVPRQQSAEDTGVPEPPKILTAPVETKVN